MSDRFGIPPNMFGSVPDEFYGLVGRVVMVAAMVELRVLDLLNALDRALTTQTEHAGKPVGVLITECRRCLGLEKRDQTLQERGSSLLDEVRKALDDRNAVVHSVWPSPSAELAYGWRPVTANKRRAAWDANASYPTNFAELGDLVAELVMVVAELDTFRQVVELDPRNT